MAIDLFKPFYTSFEVTNAIVALRIGVTESAIEKHQSHPEMKWRDATAMKLVNLLTEYLDQLDPLPPSRQQLFIDGVRDGIPKFPNAKLRPLILAEVERTVQRLGLK